MEEHDEEGTVSASTAELVADAADAAIEAASRRAKKPVATGAGTDGAGAGALRGLAALADAAAARSASRATDTSGDGGERVDTGKSLAEALAYSGRGNDVGFMMYGTGLRFRSALMPIPAVTGRPSSSTE